MATDTKTRNGAKAETGARTAVVTGASSGIGEEFGRQLSQRGYDVVLVARRRDRLEAIARQIGGKTEVIEADLGTPAGVAAVTARIAKGDVEVLINNAGFGTNGDFVEMPIERELEEIDLNVRALTQLSHAALRPMKARRSGTIINVGSIGSYQPVPYMTTYAATKAYVLFFSEGLHEEAKSYGVTVTCVCPGPVETEFHTVAGVRAEVMHAGWTTKAKVVDQALHAARSGSAIAVPGFANKTTTNMPRVLPRALVRRVAGRMFKKKG